jgi:uncharacterized membrane protein YfcA
VGSLSIGISAVLAFIVLGQQLGDNAGLTGYLHLPAWLIISLTSMACAPLGVRLTQKIPVRRLQQGFAVFLALVSLNIFFG